MRDFLVSSTYIGLLITLGFYLLGTRLQKRCRFPLCNPLLISIAATIIYLLISKVEYSVYASSTNALSYLLTPATVCLAIPLYEQLEPLKKNGKAILAGIFSGVITSLVTVLLLAMAFGLSHEDYVTLLPKSITTAIGMGVSEELGGYVSITVACIIVTGVLGNIFAEIICRLFRITEPVARGVGIGTATHAIGTARAMEIGPVEGAMSSLSIVVAGVITVVGAAVFANFY